jgi:hypothetical protein
LKINERQAQKLGVTVILSAQKKKIVADVKHQIESRQKQEDKEIDSFGSKPGALQHHYSIIGTTNFSQFENGPEKIYRKLILADSEIDLERT